MALSDYAKVEKALRYLEQRTAEQPSLAEVAEQVGLSEFHFQRLFQRWAGVSPKRFLQYLTLQEAKRLLQDSRSVLEASLEVGLSSPSRLHDLFLSLERMTPGDYKAQAAGLRVGWGVAETPFGPALFAALDRGLCGMDFLLDDGADGALDRLRARWPGARLESMPAMARQHAEALAARLEGHPSPLGLVLKGTPFQLQTWEALLRIPPGRTVSYGDLAALSGAPGASRAIGTAVSRNPIAVFIPCHRVIQATGAFGDYHWGSVRKQALLAFEGTRLEARSA